MNNKYRYYTVSDDPEFMLKLPKILLADLQKSAKESGRHLNTEILIRLARTFTNQDIEALEHNMLAMLFGGDE